MPKESNSNNATAPAPAIAPGADSIDTRAFARTLKIDPRIPAAVPGFDAPFFQAGLAGYSDAAMRIIARRHGCPYCVTEALLDRTLLAGGRGFAKADLGEIADNVPGGAEDHPLAGQIMGSTPEEMAAAALKMIEQGARHDREYKTLAWGIWNPPGLPIARTPSISTPHITNPEPRTQDSRRKAQDSGLRSDISNFKSQIPLLPSDPSPKPHAPSPSQTFSSIDVNLACPVKKIKNKARGGHWLREPDGAIEILKAVREAVPQHIPCTLKIRRSFDDTPEMARNFERIFDAAYELNYAWTTVHARTVEQKYVGPSRWTFLRELVARHPDRIIFGSGDIWDVHDIFRMIAFTGVHAVSVARGCIGNPWVFRQARQMMAGLEPTAPTIAEQRAVLEEHFILSAALHGENGAGKLMRKFAIRFAAHHPCNEEVRIRFIETSSLEQWRAVLDHYYTQSFEGLARTTPMLGADALDTCEIEDPSITH